MSRRFCILMALFFIFSIFASPAWAHFGIIIPSSSMVTDKKDAKITLDIAFAHPFSQQGMDMARPREAFVFFGGRKTQLPALREIKYLDHPAWQGEFTLGRPGVYQFAVSPEPYFEPAEDCFIVHYAKTVVAAYGNEEGWDEPVGLPAEIVPLSRPFGNYAGNVFQGVVLRDGKPQPGVVVEVENLNSRNKHKAPNVYFETQVVKTDANGVFTFGIPWEGWWGFAALMEGAARLEMKGELKDLEVGAVLWTNFSAAEE